MFLVANQTGVQGVFGSSGATDEIAVYSPYGKQTITSGSAVTPFGFQGSYTDATGLIYLINRYYDPSTGSFVIVDPDVMETGQAYGYAGDDPVDNIDPLGLWGPNPFSDIAEAGSDLGHGVASSFDQFRHSTASLVDLPPSMVMSTGEAVYNAYDQIYQDGANGCSFFSLGTQEDVAGALIADESAASLADGEGEAAEVSTDLVPWQQYPSGGGFIGEPIEDTLQPGTRISRYGGSGGTYASPESVPFSARGLPPEAESGPYGVYEVVQPTNVEGGIAQYWMGGGGGIQYRFPQSIQSLLDQGTLKDVGG